MMVKRLFGKLIFSRSPVNTYFCRNFRIAMLSVSNLSVQFGKRILFDEVSTQFTTGNIYGIIGANGAGKSTFLKIISGKQDPTSGQVHLEKGKRMSVLEQNHNEYDDFMVLETVVRGNTELFSIKQTSVCTCWKS